MAVAELPGPSVPPEPRRQEGGPQHVKEFSCRTIIRGFGKEGTPFKYVTSPCIDVEHGHEVEWWRVMLFGADTVCYTEWVPLFWPQDCQLFRLHTALPACVHISGPSIHADIELLECEVCYIFCTNNYFTFLMWSGHPVFLFLIKSPRDQAWRRGTHDWWKGVGGGFSGKSFKVSYARAPNVLATSLNRVI